jgi:hypothetical protein
MLRLGGSIGWIDDLTWEVGTSSEGYLLVDEPQPEPCLIVCEMLTHWTSMCLLPCLAWFENIYQVLVFGQLDESVESYIPMLVRQYSLTKS